MTYKTRLLTLLRACRYLAGLDIKRKTILIPCRFLLATLHVDSLLDRTTKKKVRATLTKLQKGSEALDVAYKSALDRIDGQLPGHRKLARQALSWITYARRQLTNEELRHAPAIELWESTLGHDNLVDVDDIVSVCAGLVTIDKGSNTIRLNHYTAQEYFERTGSEWNAGAQEEIAAARLTYLSFDTFKNGVCAGHAALRRRIADSPFFNYAARFWSEHLQALQQPCRTHELALTFLCDDALVDSALQMRSARVYGSRYFTMHPATRSKGPHLVARYGSIFETELLLQLKSGSSVIDIDSKDSYGRTPLSYAAERGHEQIAQLLLATDQVDVNSKNVYGRTPLSYAVEEGHKALVQLLFATNRLGMDAKDSFGMTPLSWAAWRGSKSVVQLLLDTGQVDVDSKDFNGRTPLSLAAMEGNEAVVQLLLATGQVDVNSKGIDGRTPLLWAARAGRIGNKSVVQLLLDTGQVDVNAMDNLGEAPLFRALKTECEAVIHLLQSAGATTG